MKWQRQRKAFSMITAIFLIVIMATIGAFVMNLGGKIVKITTAQYQHEQALLYAKSYTEYALLAVTGNNRSANCLRTITGSVGASPSTGNGYDISATVSYIGTPAGLGSCTGSSVLSNTVTRTDTPLTVIIDVFVKFKDPDNASGPWLTVYRRSVQKI